MERLGTINLEEFTTAATKASPQELSEANGERGFAGRWPSYWLVFLTLTAVILEISFLSSKSIWYDESMTEYRAGLPLDSLWDVLAHGQMNMSLYYLLMHGWTALAGSSEFMLRLPSVFFAALTVPLVYALGAELRGSRTGLLAALLVTVNATYLEYAQTARSYTLLMALTTLGSLFFIRSVKRGAPASLVGYIVSISASVYAHLFGVFVVPAQWLSLFVLRPGKKTAFRLTAGMFLIGVLIVPAFYFAISGDNGNDLWVKRTSLDSIRGLLIFLVGGFDEQLTGITATLLVLYAIGIGLAVLWMPRSDRPVLGFLLLSIGVPIGLTIAVSFLKPLFVTRYLLGGLPLLAVLAAIGLQRLRPALVLAMTVAMVTMGLAEDYSYYRAPSHEEWRGAVGFVALNAQPGDRMLIFPPDYHEAIGYYVSRLAHPETFPTRVFQTRVVQGITESPEQLLQESDNGAGRRIWLIFPHWSPLNQMPLEAVFPKERIVDESSFTGLRVLLFERVRRSLLGPGTD
jgi:mannosyltransferase